MCATVIILCGAPRLAVSQPAGTHAKNPPGFVAVTAAKTDGKTAISGRLAYGHHRIRVDVGEQTSSIVDLRSAEFVMVLHEARVFARTTLAQMKAHRARVRAQALAEIDKLPPAARRILRAQMDQQDIALTRVLAVQDTAESDRVNGMKCRQVRWTSAVETGEACLATDVPGVDLSGLQADARAFAERLAAAGLGTEAVALPVVTLAPRGLAVRVRTTTRLGQTQAASVTTLQSLEPASPAVSHFSPPATYRQVTPEQLISLR